MTGKTRDDHRLLGTLRAADGAGVVCVQDRYDTGIDDLWSALVDPVRLARWYGRVDGDLRPGGQFRLHIEPAGWDGVGRIDVCEPPRRLQVTTKEATESYQQIITATLDPDGEQTNLTIEIQGMPLAKVAFYGAGWQIHAENLAAHIAGQQPGNAEARLNALVPGYQELAADLGEHDG